MPTERSTATPTISSSLLGRARSIAAEHDRLSRQIQHEYNSRTAQKIGELSPTTKALNDWETATTVGNLSWNRMRTEKSYYPTQSITELQHLLKDPSNDAELRSLATDEIEQTSSQLPSLLTALQSSLIPPDPFAAHPCLLEIRPGAGGSEAGIFAGDLLRMYQAFCKRHSLPVSLVKLDASAASKSSKSSSSHLDEIQEAILDILQPGAYGVLKCEAGVHRVQRVPATETQGRTHTSAASVLVLPSFPGSDDDGGGGEKAFDDPTSDYYIPASDVRTDVMRARGAGGQHVNTTDSAIRLTHMPTATVVAIQDARSQHKNRAKAWQVLRAKVALLRREAREDEKARLRVSVVGVARMGRGDKVRTYNWGQQRVTDHRSGCTVNSLGDVLEGGGSLDEVMESVRGWMRERDVEALVADEEAAAKRGG